MTIPLVRPPASSPWFRIYRPRPNATARLVCLPHAGGAASFFRGWIDNLPDAVELIAVQYPGREERIDDESVDTMSTLVDALVKAMSAIVDRPYLLFGHSMGAAVAHELCLALMHRGLRLPKRMVVSAREAPMHHRSGHWHCATDAALCQELVRLGGTSPALLQSDELRALMLPVIRSDYRLIETYRPTRCEALLPLSISAFVGRDDGELISGQATDWALFAAGEFELRAFHGGHFYLQDQKAAVVADLVHLLQISYTSVWPSTP